MKDRELKITANRIRRHVINAVHSAGSGHPGGSLSISEILTLLYFEEMKNIDPKNPKNPGRDRFVLSKGHCSPALYGTLAERGFFSADLITKFRQAECCLQGHPSMKDVPGVDMSTGSLGQGISTACGMALSAKLDGKDYRVYTILGDGETEEGQVWEASMFAAHYKLDNLCAILDFNGLQIDGNIADVMSPLPLDQKFMAFNWNVIYADAHDFDSLREGFAKARGCKGKPSIIIAKSTKGKGVSFMENQAAWHGNAPNDEQHAQAIAELNAAIKELGGEI
ncbi:MAG: Transketolase 2 [Firmicutes bacterium ADurb.Bin193]|nr:MAG: Transketolase 2 [Firmicutes bacterium ADurb.Bin193]